ncbi:hypothetical protein QTP86_016775 [Hemibagrus guttatus]|nr:hypothetical protein QTP86_016775 [Hemibagrus guttatus]
MHFLKHFPLWGPEVTVSLGRPRHTHARLPKQLLYGELSFGKQRTGGQHKHFKDSLKVSLKTMGISSDSWEELAQDRIAWHSAANKGFKEAKAKRADESRR